MFDLQKEVKSARRMKLRLAVVRALRSAGGWRYLKMLHSNCRWPTDEEFYTVIEELIADGVVMKVIGRDSGVKLVLKEVAMENNYKENKNG